MFLIVFFSFFLFILIYILFSPKQCRFGLGVGVVVLNNLRISTGMNEYKKSQCLSFNVEN
jgi:hypothetical protein